LGLPAFRARTGRLAGETASASLAAYLIAGLAVLAYTYDHTHWTSDQRQIAVGCVVLFGVFVVASVINGLLSAALMVLDHFLWPAANQVMKSVTCLAVLPFLGHGEYAAFLIAASYSSGEVIRCGMLTMEYRRAVRRSLPDAPSVDSQKTVGPSFWRSALPTVTALAVASVSPLVDRGVAAPLARGSVTILDLAERVFYAPLTVLTPLVVVAGTRWAATGRADLSASRTDLFRNLRRGVAISAVLAVATGAIAVLSAAAVGEHVAGARTTTVLLTTLYLLPGLAPAYVVAAASRFLTAVELTRFLPAFAVTNVSLNLVFDLIGAKLLGVEGIALSSSAYRVVVAALFVLLVRRLDPTNPTRAVWRRPSHSSPPDCNVL
jgi:peptidoglycan biosynthesis protein MviN/MurJ (putative lipid II flippase)